MHTVFRGFAPEGIIMNAHVQRNGFFAGRSLLLMATIAFHVVVVGALLAIKIAPHLDDAPPAMKAVVIEVANLNPKPVVKTNLDDVKTDMALPVEPTPVFEPEEIAPSQTIATVEPTGEPNTGISSTDTALSFRALKSTDAYYPPASIRLQETGVAQVQACVTSTGELSRAPSLLASSGSPRLDTAAMAWVGEALRFTPATQNGVPVASCKGFRVVFKLR
jgi:TonB family protein